MGRKSRCAPLPSYQVPRRRAAQNVFRQTGLQERLPQETLWASRHLGLVAVAGHGLAADRLDQTGLAG